MKLRSLICLFIVAVWSVSSALCAMPMNYSSVADNAAITQVQGALPDAYCMRDEYIVYAQHQDGLGYCWNFASTMAAATTIMKATGEYYDFSELWTGVSLNNCETYHDNIGEGGVFSYHYDAIRKSGFMLESDLPYSNSYTVSNENSADYYNFFEKYSNDDLAKSIIYTKDTSYSSTEVDKIKSHIYSHGSVYLAFSFRTGFEEKDGVYALAPNQEKTTSSHAVSVIGWDDNYEKEFYLNGSDTPTVFRGAWIILNSYTEKNGNDGISMIFYDDENISGIYGYTYSPDVSGDMYFYDKIESGYAYPTSVKGKYYGDYVGETAQTKQKNIFYDDVDLEYSYVASPGATIKSIDIYLGNRNVTDLFSIHIDGDIKRFYVSKKDAPYGQYKMLVTYGNGEKTDTYLNNFFVTYGLFGEEIEFDTDKNSLGYGTGRDLEYLSHATAEKNYVIYTNKLSGEVEFLPTESSVYSEKNMSIPKLNYDIENGVSSSQSYKIKSDCGYELEYNFIFEYCDDETMQPVNVYYDLGGGINHQENYGRELASPEKGLALYAPVREGYTFAGWYLDYGNGSKKIPETNGVYYVGWDDIHHLGENPGVYAKSYYQKYYKNSNTVFVYARWVEDEYYDVNINIGGNGTSQIGNSISVRSGETVKYLLNPAKGWCVSELKINGEIIVGDKLVDVMERGLILENIGENQEISVTFSEGVYISLKYGENVKTAYILGTKDGESRKFFNGDFIPVEYFSEIKNEIFPSIGPKEFFGGKEQQYIGTLLPGIPILPSFGFGSRFTIVVEVFDDHDGYTYVPYNATLYSVSQKGVFEKTITIDENDKYKDIDVGSATQILIEEVKVTYSVGQYVDDHYISLDKDAVSGERSLATFNAGDIVYLFVRKPSDDFMYKYTLPTTFESIGNRWYRMAVCVNSENPHLGTITVSRESQKYTVTWENWDGSTIYSEQYKYGAKPVFNNRNAEIKDHPVKPDDELYTYEFIGWDKDISAVRGDVTYVARYEAVLKKYAVTIESSGNGTVTPDVSGFITGLDRHTYIFTPDDGYRIKDVIINGESKGAITNFTFTDVRSDQIVRVEFELIKHVLCIISGENGSVAFAGFDKAGEGTEVNLEITPDEALRIDFIPDSGHRVKDVIIDNISLGAISSYTFIDVSGDHTVFVEFEAVNYVIHIICGDNGSVASSDFDKVGEKTEAHLETTGGKALKMDFTPKFGYKVKDVKINGVSIGATNEYAFVDVNRDYTVSVEFERDVALIVAITVVPVVFIATAAFAVLLAVKKGEDTRLNRLLQKISGWYERSAPVKTIPESEDEEFTDDKSQDE